MAVCLASLLFPSMSCTRHHSRKIPGRHHHTSSNTYQCDHKNHPTIRLSSPIFTYADSVSFNFSLDNGKQINSKAKYTVRISPTRLRDYYFLTSNISIFTPMSIKEIGVKATFIDMPYDSIDLLDYDSNSCSQLMMDSTAVSLNNIFTYRCTKGSNLMNWHFKDSDSSNSDPFYGRYKYDTKAQCLFRVIKPMCYRHANVRICLSLNCCSVNYETNMGVHHHKGKAHLKDIDFSFMLPPIMMPDDYQMSKF